MAYWKNYLDYEKRREETYGNIYKKLGMDYNEVNEKIRIMREESLEKLRERLRG